MSLNISLIPSTLGALKIFSIIFLPPEAYINKSNSLLDANYNCYITVPLNPPNNTIHMSRSPPNCLVTLMRKLPLFLAAALYSSCQ